MKKKLFTILIFCIGSCSVALCQDLAVKTNLFYGGYTLTPNLGAEVGIGKRSTLDLGGGYNPWNRHGTVTDNKKLVHWLGQIEYRYWLCQKFNGHFFGVHALGSQYNISQHKLPMLFGKHSKDYRYEGWAVGAGISYGYQFILGKRWNLELNIGVGYARLEYDKYECKKCGQKIGSEHKNYFGPTKAGVSIMFMIK